MIRFIVSTAFFLTMAVMFSWNALGAEESVSDALKPNEYRTWTNLKGVTSREAAFLHVSGTNAYFITESGERLSATLDLFAEKDLALFESVTNKARLASSVLVANQQPLGLPQYILALEKIIAKVSNDIGDDDVQMMQQSLNFASNLALKDSSYAAPVVGPEAEASSYKCEWRKVCCTNGRGRYWYKWILVKVNEPKKREYKAASSDEFPNDRITKIAATISTLPNTKGVDRNDLARQVYSILVLLDRANFVPGKIFRN